MKAAALFALGKAVGRDDLARIEQLCTEALAADPADIVALMVLADAYWRHERPADALPLARRVLESDPGDFHALRIVAGILAERGEHEAAYLHAKRLLAAPVPARSPTRVLARLLWPLAWWSRARQLRDRLVRRDVEGGSSRAEWLQWAREYVDWHEREPRPQADERGGG